jgi:hypothetical protein
MQIPQEKGRNERRAQSDETDAELVDLLALVRETGWSDARITALSNTCATTIEPAPRHGTAGPPPGEKSDAARIRAGASPPRLVVA